MAELSFQLLCQWQFAARRIGSAVLVDGLGTMNYVYM
jgi:hypothetical protein